MPSTFSYGGPRFLFLSFIATSLALLLTMRLNLGALVSTTSFASIVGSQNVGGNNNSTTPIPQWHPPNSTQINNLSSVINGTGVYGFIFNTSDTPDGKYGTYNWCNMPHVRAQEYPIPGPEYQLQYVEVIHRHHKRTPYAANSFPIEPYPWNCNDEGLFYYGEPLPADGSAAATPVYWNITTSPANPFNAPGFAGSCDFPQITCGGLEDSYQHGADLRAVYHDLLHFLPAAYSPATTSFSVTNNIITFATPHPSLFPH